MKKIYYQAITILCNMVCTIWEDIVNKGVKISINTVLTWCLPHYVIIPLLSGPQPSVVVKFGPGMAKMYYHDIPKKILLELAALNYTYIIALVGYVASLFWFVPMTSDLILETFYLDEFYEEYSTFRDELEKQTDELERLKLHCQFRLSMKAITNLLLTNPMFWIGPLGTKYLAHKLGLTDFTLSEGLMLSHGDIARKMIYDIPKHLEDDPEFHNLTSLANATLGEKIQRMGKKSYAYVRNVKGEILGSFESFRAFYHYVITRLSGAIDVVDATSEVLHTQEVLIDGITKFFRNMTDYPLALSAPDKRYTMRGIFVPRNITDLRDQQQEAIRGVISSENFETSMTKVLELGFKAQRTKQTVDNVMENAKVAQDAVEKMSKFYKNPSVYIQTEAFRKLSPEWQNYLLSMAVGLEKLEPPKSMPASEFFGRISAGEDVEIVVNEGAVRHRTLETLAREALPPPSPSPRKLPMQRDEDRIVSERHKMLAVKILSLLN